MTQAKLMSVDVLGVGLVGPGMASWASSVDALRGATPYVPAATVVPSPQRLPATERRRAGTIIKVSIHVADEALAMSGLDARDLPTVFSASEGDGKNCHELCEALAAPVAERLVSPTRFTNSVHNAAAGYWHIATQSMAASTSLCAHDASWVEGLVEAVVQVQSTQAAVMLVVADQPYPEPLHATRPLADAMGVALVLGPHRAGSASRDAEPRALGTLHVGLALRANSPPTLMHDTALETLRRALPTARALPLLAAIAGNTALHAVDGFVLEGHHDLSLRVAWTPATQP